jgi:hypothetical protein
MVRLGGAGSGGEGPQGSDWRGTRRHGWNAQTQREGAFWQMCQGFSGRLGRVVKQWPAGRGRLARRRAGPAGSARPNHRRDSNGNDFFQFQMNLEFGNTLRISTRRFRRNLDMRIFPKFFLASPRFFKNEIFHAMNATLGQLN